MNIPFYFTRVGQAAKKFARDRADWYEYLADITEDTQGRRTFLSILDADAQRYGKSARGILSGYWAHRIVETGDLGRTLHQTLPPREVAEFVSLQAQGQGVFADGLRDMAAVVRLTAKLKVILVSTLAVAALMLILVWSMLMVGIPYFTAPMFLDAMPDIRMELLNPSTQSFFDMAQWIREKGTRLWLASVTLGVAIYLSFPYMDNGLRRWLDKWGPYRLYRDVQAIAVVSTTATAVKPRAGKVMQIRQAIELQLPGASRWLMRRLHAIQNRLDDAKKGAEIFDVGLLDREIYWYLEDLNNTLGLDTALQMTRARMETTILKRVEGRAKVLRWLALLGAVAIMISLFIWHQGVILDMRNAIMIDATS